MFKQNEERAMSLQVTDGLSVAVIPDLSHEFLMVTKEVAKGYGVGVRTIQQHLQRNPNDFIEEKHVIKGTNKLFAPCTKVGTNCSHPSGLQSGQIFWTKRGIIRLGFFVKSDLARLFRDWAEDLIIHQMDAYSENLTEADLPPYINDIRYEFDSRVRRKLINDILFFKVRDVSLMCRVPDTSSCMKRLPSLDNFMKMTTDHWNVAEWWCNEEGLKQFLQTKKNPNFIRLYDALFGQQLTLFLGGREK